MLRWRYTLGGRLFATDDYSLVILVFWSMAEAFPSSFPDSPVHERLDNTACVGLVLLCQLLRAFNAPALIVLGGCHRSEHLEQMKEYANHVSAVCSACGCAAVFPLEFWRSAALLGRLVRDDTA